MIVLDAAKAGQALGVGTLRSPLSGVSIDTRTLRQGDLFVALRGERFDGHDFVVAALEAGASGAVVEEVAWQERVSQIDDERPPIYRVKDTREALGSLAREVRRSSKAMVVAITGSAGKTSTKDVLRAMLGRVGKVVATSGNQNNEVGVPLTLLRAEADTQWVVVEMGMRGPGQIAELAAMAEPDVGVITNVYPVHLELLGSIEEVARAKAELMTGIKRSGVAVIPADGGPLESFVSQCACRIVRFGTGPVNREEDPGGQVVASADVIGRLEQDGEGRYWWVVCWPDGEARLPTGYMSTHGLENATAAAAACFAAGLPMESCLAGIGNVELSHGRGQTTEVGGVCVIDDSYNANPEAVRAAVIDLVRLARDRGGRAVAVLGDMLELGSESSTFHEQAGAMAAEAGVSVLWGVGPMSGATVGGFLSWCESNPRKGSKRSAQHVESAEDAGGLIESLRSGDVVLVKGSRGVRLENVVIRVLAEGEAGRWSGGAAFGGMDSDPSREKPHCCR